MLDAIELLSPDVLVLTEYVPGRDHERFIADLKDLRFETPLISQRAPKENQVLIAARRACEAGAIRAPNLVSQSPPNFLEARLPSFGLRVVGLRIPMFRKREKTEERQYWEWLVSRANVWNTEPTLIIGDLNIDPTRNTWRAKELRSFTLMGWQIADPAGEWSYHGRGTGHSRIDHALVTNDIEIVSAAYRTKVGNILLASGDGTALSDHAVLEVKISRPRPGTV